MFFKCNGYDDNRFCFSHDTQFSSPPTPPPPPKRLFKIAFEDLGLVSLQCYKINISLINQISAAMFS